MIQKNIIVIPKSINPARIEENFNIFDFSLSDEEINELNNQIQDLRLFQQDLYNFYIIILIINKIKIIIYIFFLN